MSDDRTRRRNRAATRVSYQIDELFQGIMLNSARPSGMRVKRESDGGWRPAIDVFEIEDSLNVVAELAGVREEQIRVSLDEDILRIRGERTPMNSDPNRSVHEIGIQYGPFAADIYLPYGVDHKGVEAQYENGLLQIRLRKTAPTQIAVTYVDQESPIDEQERPETDSG